MKNVHICVCMLNFTRAYNEIIWSFLGKIYRGQFKLDSRGQLHWNFRIVLHSCFE